jgi:hypothetical protein
MNQTHLLLKPLSHNSGPPKSCWLRLAFLSVAFAYFAVLPLAEAVDPPPDGPFDQGQSFQFAELIPNYEAVGRRNNSA